MNMAAQIIKTAKISEITKRLEGIQNGTIRLGVNNQHDEYVAEQALANADKFSAEFWIENAHRPAFDLAHFELSNVNIEPLSDGWTQ